MYIRHCHLSLKKLASILFGNADTHVYSLSARKQSDLIFPFFVVWVDQG